MQLKHCRHKGRRIKRKEGEKEDLQSIYKDILVIR